MMLRGRTKNLVSRALLVAASLALSAPAFGGDDCTTCWHRCPPPYVHWAEGPPRLWFRCASPRPVCDPCNLEHHGYYPTCWRPWSFTNELNHCLAPKSGAETGVREALPSAGERQMPVNPAAPGSGAKPQ